MPKTVGSLGTAYVGGATASSVDFNNQLSSRAPYVFVFVLGLAFLLLLWNFRSVVIPATAILLNLLSVGAAYGVLVPVFQGGGGSSTAPRAPRPDCGVAAALPVRDPLRTFDGLPRVHPQPHPRGLRPRPEHAGGDPARHHRSAGVITSAAIVMVAVFAASPRSRRSIQAARRRPRGRDPPRRHVVRGRPVPAVMTLLGDRNWYLPRWLDQVIPRHRIELPETAAQPIHAAHPIGEAA